MRTKRRVKAYTTALVLVVLLAASLLSLTLLDITSQNRKSFERSESLNETLFYLRQNEIRLRESILEVSNAIPTQIGFSFGDVGATNYLRTGRVPGRTALISETAFQSSNAGETIPQTGAIFVLTVLSRPGRSWSNFAVYKKSVGSRPGAKSYLPAFRYLDNGRSSAQWEKP